MAGVRPLSCLERSGTAPRLPWVRLPAPLQAEPVRPWQGSDPCHGQRRHAIARLFGARDALSLGYGLEAVADAVAGLDEGVAWGAPVDLLAQAADEDVDGAVAAGLAAAPQLLEELVSRDDAVL